MMSNKSYKSSDNTYAGAMRLVHKSLVFLDTGFDLGYI